MLQKNGTAVIIWARTGAATGTLVDTIIGAKSHFTARSNHDESLIGNVPLLNDFYEK